MNRGILRITMSLWLLLAACSAGRAADVLNQFKPDILKLGQEPTEYSAKLNETCHFLTAAVYEKIASLEERGDKRDAASLAQAAYATFATEQANSIRQAEGLLERAWDAVANAGSDWVMTQDSVESPGLMEQVLNSVSVAAKGAWDAMLSVGRPVGPDQKAAEIGAQIVKGRLLLATHSTEFNKAVIFAQLVRLQSRHEFAIAAAANASNVAKALKDAQAYEAKGVAGAQSLGKLFEYGALDSDKSANALSQFHAEVIRHDRDNPDNPYSADKVAAGEKFIRDKFKDTVEAQREKKAQQIWS